MIPLAHPYLIINFQFSIINLFNQYHQILAGAPEELRVVDLQDILLVLIMGSVLIRGSWGIMGSVLLIIFYVENLDVR